MVKYFRKRYAKCRFFECRFILGSHTYVVSLLFRSPRLSSVDPQAVA